MEIPVGAIVELRNSNEDWRLVSYWDNEVPMFCRQYVIQSLQTGQTKRVFKHELFEKNTSTYQDLYDFFREQLSQEIQDDFNNSNLSDPAQPHTDIQGMLQEEESVNVSLPDSPHLSTHEPPEKRFKSVTDEDVENLAAKTTEVTTNAMTKWAIKLFKGA